MTATAPVVIVGASLAGATAALALRELGHDGDIVLVGDEHELPYERPALSKEFLLGEMTADQLSVRPRETYDELGVELRLGVRADALDVDRRHVLLDPGGHLAYSAVVIATGASNVRPPIPGIDLAGVYQLRTLADAAALRRAATAGGSAVVVGMGFIGAEVAASLRRLGMEVTAIDGVAGPLLAQLGPQLSERVRAWHEEHGVKMLFERSVVNIAEDGARLAVETSADDRVSGDLVVVGVGVRPNIGWLHATPLHMAAGVAVDVDGRTNLPDVFAVGDAAATWDERAGRHRRFEHWDNAIEQGRRAAHAVLGLVPPPAASPYFWSAQYGHYLQYVGEHPPDAAVVHVREVAPGRLSVFYVDSGDVLRAAVTIDNGKELRHARALLGHTVDPRLLVDPAVVLRDLASIVAA